MNKYYSIAHRLPRFLSVPLCGKREFSFLPRDLADQDYKQSLEDCMKYYNAITRGTVGSFVNKSGYDVLSTLDLTGKHCMEIGPGTFPHIGYWKGTPASYDIVDIRQEMLTESAMILERANIPHTAFLVKDSPILPMQDATYDAIVSFYSLEHLFPLEGYLAEFRRVLRPGGSLIGALPTEGGLGWGLGRMLTSRRWTRKHCTWDFDKIIAWEHCNTAEEVLTSLDRWFAPVKKSYWPLRVPLIDTNLVIKFQYKKTDSREIACVIL